MAGHVSKATAITANTANTAKFRFKTLLIRRVLFRKAKEYAFDTSFNDKKKLSSLELLTIIQHNQNSLAVPACRQTGSPWFAVSVVTPYSTAFIFLFFKIAFDSFFS